MRAVLLAIVAFAAACGGVPSGKGSQGSACLRCHPGASPRAQGGGRTLHAPFRASACAECHRPHPPGGGLTSLTAPEPGLCQRCHPGIGAAHPPGARAGCTGCHAPHASDEAKLLVARRAELCDRCHATARLAAAHAGYPVDAGRCWRCHPAHGGARSKLLRDVVHPVAAECALCHAPATSPTPFAPAQPEPDLCFACHDRPPPDRKVLHAPFASGRCTECHDPHASRAGALLRAREQDLCLGCHPAIRAKLGAAARHEPARAACVTCHAPHASRERSLLAEAEGALCARCHPEPGAWARSKVVHAPVRDGRCSSCHDAHGGRARLLVQEPSTSCGRCHPGRGRGHSAADCTACHVPHASDSARLLAGPAEARCAGCHRETLERPRANRHGPFAKGACLTCHDVHAGAPRLVRGAPGAVCLTCHAEIGKADAGAASRHAPSAAGACTFCHDPHGADRPKHLRQETALLCLSCHAELQARIRKKTAVLHAPVKAGTCLECHRPHASASPRLLAAEPPALCSGCHFLGGEPMARAHPGFTPRASRCTGCHDPHVVRE